MTMRNSLLVIAFHVAIAGLMDGATAQTDPFKARVLKYSAKSPFEADAILVSKDDLTGSIEQVLQRMHSY